MGPGCSRLTDLMDDYAFKKRAGKPIKRKQTKVLGLKYGDWGKKTYPGVKPVETDAMDWYVQRLIELRRLILEEQPKAMEHPASTAFVTFRHALLQVCCGSFGVHSLLR